MWASIRKLPKLAALACLSLSACWLDDGSDDNGSSGETQDVVISDYVLVQSKPASDTEDESIYKARIVSGAGLLFDATASLVSANGHTIVDRTLIFGNVSQGVSTLSRDTFKLRHRREASPDVTQLRWLVSSTPASGALIELDTQEISPPAGSSASMRVRLTRDAAHRSGIDVRVRGLPLGITATRLVLKPDIDAGTLQFSVAPGTPPGTVNSVIEASEGDRVLNTAPLVVNVRGSIASPQELIEAARQQGAISLETSLLYRAYARFGDGRLPENYWGSGRSQEDRTLVSDVERIRGQLSHEFMGALEPFLVRPTDPRSVLNRRYDESKEVSLTWFPVSEREIAHSSSFNQSVPCTTKWTPLDGRGFRVWIQSCDWDTAQEINAHAGLAHSAVDRAWKAFAPFMRPPVLDNDENDGQIDDDRRIDFYFPKYGEPISSTRTRQLSNEGETGLTVPEISRHASPGTASAYVLIGHDLLSSQELFFTVAHELFHVHQIAISNVCGLPTAGPTCSAYWFDEASARWASHYAVRKEGTDLEKELAHVQETAEFAAFQASSNPLNSRHYHAFVWPLFAELESNRHEFVISDLWEGLARASSPSGALLDGNAALRALDSTFSFRDNFMKFALRNFNRRLSENENIPALVPLVADGIEPGGHIANTPLEIDRTEGLPRVPEILDLQPLAAKYLHLTLTSQGQRRQWIVDFASLAPQDALVASAIIRTDDGKWLVRQNIPVSQPLQECGVQEMYLVLGNVALEDVRARARGTKTITGAVSVKVIESECDEYVGSIIAQTGHSKFTTDVVLIRDRTFHERFPAAPAAWAAYTTKTAVLTVERLGCPAKRFEVTNEKRLPLYGREALIIDMTDPNRPIVAGVDSGMFQAEPNQPPFECRVLTIEVFPGILTAMNVIRFKPSQASVVIPPDLSVINADGVDVNFFRFSWRLTRRKP